MQINDLTLTAVENVLWDALNREIADDRVKAAQEALKQIRESTATDIELDAARSLWASDDLEIDDDATVSRGEDGYWVQAWAWVPERSDDRD